MTTEVKEIPLGEMIAEDGMATLEHVEVIQRLVDAVRELQEESEVGRISQAENVVLSTYGDTVSVSEKKKNLNKFGTNTTVGTSFETVAQFQNAVGNETYVSTNIIDSIVSSNAGDTQTIKVEGHTIDASGNLTFVIQDATLQGQTEVALTTPLARCTRMYVANSGTFDSPQAAIAGTVVVYDNTDGITAGVPNTDAAVKCLIDAGFTQSEKCATAVSSTDYWFLTDFEAGIGNSGGAANRVTFRVEIRDVANGGVFRPLGRDIVVNIGQNGVSFKFDPLGIVPKNHDVRVVAMSNSNTAEVFAEIQGILAKII